MTVTVEAHLTLDGLDRALKAADPSAFLVPPRILRRVIKHDRQLAGLGLQVPHRKSYVIDRAAWLRVVDADEIGAGADPALPPPLLLLARPDPQRLAALPAGETLIEFWRLLFHARVHLALDQQLAQ